MADRFVTGDTVTLSNTFKVAGVATDPTTTTLLTTEPGGTSTTYTAGVLTHSTTGVYATNLVVTTTGVWSFRWTGTGAAADVADGTFTVWPVTDPIDVLTLGEAKAALSLSATDTGSDDYLRALITAVSAQLDQMCGPVRTRSTTELHDGGTDRVHLRQRPVYSLTSVIEYDGTTATTLTAESNTSKTASDYLHDGTAGRLASGTLIRRSSNTDGVFPSGRRNVSVTFLAGRAASTDGVPAKFKQAAVMMLRNVWVAEQASGSETFGSFTDNQGFNPLLGPGRLNKVMALLENELVDGVAVL